MAVRILWRDASHVAFCWIDGMLELVMLDTVPVHTEKGLRYWTMPANIGTRHSRSSMIA